MSEEDMSGEGKAVALTVHFDSLEFSDEIWIDGAGSVVVCLGPRNDRIRVLPALPT